MDAWRAGVVRKGLITTAVAETRSSNSEELRKLIAAGPVGDMGMAA